MATNPFHRPGRAQLTGPRRWLSGSAAMLALAGLAGCGAASAPAQSQASGSDGGTRGVGTAPCVTSVAKGTCGPFGYSRIQGTTADPYLGNDVWNQTNGWHQTLYATSPGQWRVTASMPTGNTAVISYPSSAASYGEKKLSSFSSLYSSFTENMHATSSTIAWATYDIWLNNWGNEVEIQNDVHALTSCSARASATFGGTGGVPVQQWKLCQYGSELIWQLTGGYEQSGQVDVLAMLTWLANHGYYPNTSTLTDISYGWELCSTGGQPETFTVSEYSITAT